MSKKMGITLSLHIIVIQLINVIDFVIIPPLTPLMGQAVGSGDGLASQLMAIHSISAAISSMLIVGFVDRVGRVTVFLLPI